MDGTRLVAPQMVLLVWQKNDDCNDDAYFLFWMPAPAANPNVMAFQLSIAIDLPKPCYQNII